jgi:hypothetical protein
MLGTRVRDKSRRLQRERPYAPAGGDARSRSMPALAAFVVYERMIAAFRAILRLPFSP